MIMRGVAAGAVGKAVLDAVTYGDMALTGRAASSVPADTVTASAERLGWDLPGGGSRPEAYGALAGAATGIGIGVLAQAARGLGVRLPPVAESAVIGAVAMAATDAPAQWSGVTDATTWSAADWTREAVPHLAYGFAVSSTLRRLERKRAAALEAEPTSPPRLAGVLARSLAIGLATGARSTLGLVGPALASGRTAAVVGTAGLVATELTLDKTPVAQPRISAAPFAMRAVLGAAGAVAVPRGDRGAALPAVVGAAGAVVGTVAGWALREACADRGWTWQSAVVEDAAALGLTAFAARR